jgi:hypothetical protein
MSDSSDTLDAVQATYSGRNSDVLKKHPQVLESIDGNSIAPL